MNGVTTAAPEAISMTTIPEAPAAPAGGEPADAKAAEVSKAQPDRSLETAKRFNEAAERVSRARRLEADLKSKEAEWATKTQSVSQKERALAEKERLLAQIEEELQGDPIAYLMKKGIDPVKIAERFAKPETEEQREIRKLRERMEAKERSDAETSRRLQEQTQKANEERAMVAFVRGITPDDCPNLTALYEAREIPELVEKLLTRTVDHGSDGRPVHLVQQFFSRHRRYPTDAEIREVLEGEAELRATRLRSARAGSSPTHRSPPQRGPSGISNQHAGQTSSGRPRPKTPEERRAEARRQLTAVLEAEAAERRK